MDHRFLLVASLAVAGKSSASSLAFAANLMTFNWLGSSWSSGIIRMSTAPSGATDLVISLFFAVEDFEWFVVLAMARDLEAGPGRDSLYPFKPSTRASLSLALGNDRTCRRLTI